MTARYADNVKEASALAVGTLLNGGTLEIRTGDAPTETTDPDSGTLLVTLNFANPAFEALTDQGADITSMAEGTAVAAGTAGHFRAKTSGGTVVMQGTVGDVVGDYDLALTKTAITVGGRINISQLALTIQGFGSDNLADIRNFYSLGTFLAAEWNVSVNKFDWQWHVDQVMAGRRLLPSIQKPILGNGLSSSGSNNPTTVANITAITAEAKAFMQDNNIPLCLRVNNIPNTFAADPYRFPLVVESIPLSGLIWMWNGGVEGVNLDDRFLIDSFGPVSNWEGEGEDWADYLLISTLTTDYPNPAYVVHVENNESAYDEGMDLFSTSTGTPNPVGFTDRTFHSNSTLLGEHIRLRDYLIANPSVSYYQFYLTFWGQRQAHFEGIYSTFQAGLPAAWGNNLHVGAYNSAGEAKNARPPFYFTELGYAPELNYYDFSSQEVYALGTSTLTDFTSPAQTDILNMIPGWEEHRSRNPNLHREIILTMSDSGSLQGAINGFHEVMTPTRYQAFCEWLYWSCREPGVPFMLRHYAGSTHAPEELFFDPSLYAQLTTYGHPELETATWEDYARPLMDAADKIMSHETLRAFALTGTPILAPFDHPEKQFRNVNWDPYPVSGADDNRWRVLECSTNAARNTWTSSYKTTIKMHVWAVATLNQAGTSVLLYVWSPETLSSTMTVEVPGCGTVTINKPQTSAYWTIPIGSTTATQLAV